MIVSIASWMNRTIFFYTYFFLLLYVFLRLTRGRMNRNVENLTGDRREASRRIGEIEFFGFERRPTSTSGSISACREQFR